MKKQFGYITESTYKKIRNMLILIVKESFTDEQVDVFNSVAEDLELGSDFNNVEINAHIEIEGLFVEKNYKYKNEEDAEWVRIKVVSKKKHPELFNNRNKKLVRKIVEEFVENYSST